MKNDEKGFSAVVAVLLVVVIGLIGGTGYYVFKSNLKENKNTNLSNPATENKANIRESMPEDRVEFKAKDNLFSLTHKKSWQIGELTGSEDMLLDLFSELPVDDPAITDRPMSKNVYFSIRFQLYDEKEPHYQSFQSENPTIFKTLTTENGVQLKIYKQVQNSRNTEQYFITDKDGNNLLLSGSKYLLVIAEFNRHGSNYDVVSKLKDSGKFDADNREEVKEIEKIAESLIF